MVGQSVEDIAGNALRARLGRAPGRESVPAVRARRQGQNYENKLPNISFSSLSEGASDAAGEGELGERGRGEAAGAWCSVAAARNLVSYASVSEWNAMWVGHRAWLGGAKGDVGLPVRVLELDDFFAAHYVADCAVPEVFEFFLRHAFALHAGHFLLELGFAEFGRFD